MSISKTFYNLTKQQKIYIGTIIFLSIIYYSCLHKSFEIPHFDNTKRLPNNINQTEKEIYYSEFIPNLNNAMLHCATSIELDNGNISVFWYSGTREGAKDVTINNSILDYKTKKWSPARIILKRHKVSKDLSTYIKKVGNPVVTKDNNNVLYLFYVTVSIGGWSGSSLNYTKSFDEGNTWTNSKSIITSPLINISTLVKCNPILMNDNKTFAIPVYHESILKFSELMYFDTETEKVIYKSRITKGRDAIQPLVLSDNKYNGCAFMRYCGKDKARNVLISKTSDAGLTWSKPEKISLFNPNAAITGCTLDNGTYLLVLNNVKNGRKSLSIAISKDQGSSWKVIHKIEDGVKNKVIDAKKHCFAYPYMTKSANGGFHIFYTWHRLEIKHIYFNTKWLNRCINNLENPIKKGVVK